MYHLESQRAWRHRRDSVETGRLTENILPKEVLIDMFNLNLPVSSVIINLINWYYLHTIVTQVTSSNKSSLARPEVTSHKWG